MAEMQGELFPSAPEPGLELVEVGLHGRIRERLDPEAEFLSDKDIQKIIRMHFSHETNIIRQCLLGIALIAEKAGKIDVAVRFRKLLFAFEIGEFSLDPDSGSGQSYSPSGLDGKSGVEIELKIDPSKGGDVSAAISDAVNEVVAGLVKENLS